VIGGKSPAPPQLIGIGELIELPQGLYGSPRAHELAQIDQRYDNNALIVADLSNDATYAEVLFETFGPRLIGLHITRHGDGMSFVPRLVKNNSIRVYTIGRSYPICLNTFSPSCKPVRSALLMIGTADALMTSLRRCRAR